MFGANEVRKYNPDATVLQVQDIWYTLQGEGPFSGHPAIFIRMTGCNLRCTFCDTKWDDANDPLNTVDALLGKLKQMSVDHKCRLFVFTGGEPLRQNLSVLWERLFDTFGEFIKIQVETAGTLWPAEMADVLTDDRITIVCSPKTHKIHPEILKRADVFKYVVRAGLSDRNDGLPIFKTQAGLKREAFISDSAGITTEPIEYRVARPRDGAPVIVMPCDDQDVKKNHDNMKEVARVALKHGYIAQLQAHKFFDVP